MATASERARAVVLLSGGMDSVVCATLAVRDYETAALHMSYGQRTEARERQAFTRICDRLGIGKRLVLENRALGLIGGSALTDRDLDIPAAGADIGHQIPITYVPFRNAHFIAAGVSWAEVLGASTIFVGAVAQDSSGYPDCRPEYYEAFNQVIRVGTREGGIRLTTPLIGLRKAEIVKLGLELGAPFDLTWSCYSREDRACGVCESCVLRLRAFEAAGAPDPIPYAVQGAAG